VKETRERIANWARWSKLRTAGGAESITAVVCDRLRAAALGNVWSGHTVVDKIEVGDAELLERVWRGLLPRHKDLLRWHYIRNASPGFICRRLGIPQRPSSVFEIELARAEAAFAAALRRMELPR